jgi:hypothetical protein
MQNEPSETHKMLWEYLETLYSNKMKNLKQMEEILNAFALQTLNQEDTIHLN